MARKRSSQNAWMPKGVGRGPSYYYYRPSGTTKTIKLASLDATPDEVKSALVSLLNIKYSFKHMADEYFASNNFKKLSKHTKNDYEVKAVKKVMPAIGHMAPNSIGPAALRLYMDIRGETSETRANIELSFISTVFSWGYEREKCAHNPAKGVRKFARKPRQTLITQDEYDLVYEHMPTICKVAMELSFCCAAREGDLINLKWEHVSSEGILIEQSKTAKRQLKLFSTRLVNAIRLAEQIPVFKKYQDKEPEYVLHTKKGYQYTEDGFRSIWHKNMVAIRKASKQKLDFTFHDIKAMAVSNYEGSSRDKQLFSGHKTESQVIVYDRSVQKVKAL